MQLNNDVMTLLHGCVQLQTVTLKCSINNFINGVVYTTLSTAFTKKKIKIIDKIFKIKH